MWSTMPSAQATFSKGLNLLRPRGHMVNYGAASGPVAPVDPMVLMEKGSIYLSRPSLQHYAALRAELEERSSAVFGMIATWKAEAADRAPLPAGGGSTGASRSGVAKDYRQAVVADVVSITRRNYPR